MSEIVAIAEGPIHRIVLNRPERLNALTHSMIDALLDALDAAAADEDCRVVHLRAEGRAFCAGDDLKGMGEDATSQRWRGRKRDVLPQQAIQASLRTLPKPVVAQIQGACLGMGFGYGTGRRHPDLR